MPVRTGLWHGMCLNHYDTFYLIWEIQIMEQSPKKRAYTKSRLIKELAFRAEISQRQSRAALEAIIEIAYREAKANYFILPGLCKFDVVRRAPRNVRNPMTGEKLVLPERDALRVSLSKHAKETVVPRVAPMTEAAYAALLAEKTAAEEATRKAAEEESARVAPREGERPREPIPTEEKATIEAPREGERPREPIHTEEKAASEVPREDERPSEPITEEKTSAQQTDDNGFVETAITGDNAISFKCTTCGQEIIAPGEAIGYEAECPACGAILLVPTASEPGTTYASDGNGEQKEVVSVGEIEDLNPAQLKSRTIRIDALMFDEEVDPNPASAADLSDALKGRTMRIDLPDEF